MLFPMITAAFPYAYEARGYGPVLGFGAVALLCWQKAAEGAGGGRGRRLALLGLAGGLALGVSSHYYAVLLLVPLGLGELARSFQRRHLDLAVWTAFASPAIPLALFAPVIRASSRYASTFWARPAWFDALQFFDDLFRPAPVAGVVVLAAFGLRLLLATQREGTAATSWGPPPRHEVVATLGLAASSRPPSASASCSF